MSDNILSEELNALYEQARNARYEGDALKAREIYEKISENDKENWEAEYFSYYQVYYDMWTTYIAKDTVKDIEKQIEEFWGCLIDAVKMIANDDTCDKAAAVMEIYKSYSDIYVRFSHHLETKAKDFSYSTGSSNTKEASDMRLLIGNIGGFAYRCAKMSYEFGDSIFTNGLNTLEINGKTLGETISYDCWEKGNRMIYFAYVTMPYPLKKDSREFLVKYSSKIRQYDNAYQPPVLPQKKGCYIATCVYGSYDCPQVWTLRRYRDEHLAKNVFGRAFIRAYYAVSPLLVRIFGSASWFRGIWKPFLDRKVRSLHSKGYEDSPYEDR